MLVVSDKFCKKEYKWRFHIDIFYSIFIVKARALYKRTEIKRGPSKKKDNGIVHMGTQRKEYHINNNKNTHKGINIYKTFT